MHVRPACLGPVRRKVRGYFSEKAPAQLKNDWTIQILSRLCPPHAHPEQTKTTTRLSAGLEALAST